MPDSFNFQIPPFNALSEYERELVRSALSVGYYVPGEALIEPDSNSLALYIVLKGVVEERGKDDQLFAHYGPDDFFDVRGLLSGQIKHAYRAVEESIVYELNAKMFHDLCERNSAFDNYFHASLAAKRQLARRDGQNLAEFILTRIAYEHLLPAVEVRAELSIREAACKQLDVGADALLVRLEDGFDGLGIVTRTDLMAAHFRQGLDDATPVRSLAHQPLASVELGDFLFDAMILMTRQRIERVVVRQKGQAVGLLHLTQVLSLFSTHSHVLALRIARAETLEDLQRAAETLDTLIATLEGNGIRLRFIMQLVSALNEQLLARVFEYSVPAAFRSRCCLLVMGSEGRGEQLLKTDQDNALIHADDISPEEALVWMSHFTQALAGFGYPPCPGGVMASAPLWCKPLSEWRHEIWMTAQEGKPDQLLRLSILMDAYSVAGNEQWFTALRASLESWSGPGERWLSDMALAALQFDTPLTLFGGLKTSDERLDIKRGGLFPIVHGARILALREGIMVRGTLNRLQALGEQGILDRGMADNLAEAFELFMQVRLSQQLATSKDGLEQGINVSLMSRAERDLLRFSLHVVKKFKQTLVRQFHLDTR
jgi:CBS domain-containing protein